MATPQKAVKKLTSIQLRRIREEIYKIFVLPRPRGLFTGINSETFHVPSTGSRVKNFKDFIGQNFIQGFNPGAWPNTINNLPVYHKLLDYANTEYGAAMIYRVLQDNKKIPIPVSRSGMMMALQAKKHKLDIILYCFQKTFRITHYSRAANRNIT